MLGLGNIGCARRITGDGREGGAFCSACGHQCGANPARRDGSQFVVSTISWRSPVVSGQSSSRISRLQSASKSKTGCASVCTAPVLHDDQHGTAVVVLAAVINATRRAGRELGDCVIGQIGLGAAGIGIVRLLTCAGGGRVLGTDINEGARARFAAMGGKPSTLEEIMGNCDIVIAATGRARPGQACDGTQGSDHPGALEPGLRDRATDRAATWRRVRRRWQGDQQRAGIPGAVQGRVGCARAALHGHDAAGGARRIADLAPGDDLVPDALDRDVHIAVAAAVQKAV